MADRAKKIASLSAWWVAESPEQSLRELPLLDLEEHHQILVGWNQTAAECPRDTPIHRLVLRSAESEPERVAIEDGDLEITYGELQERACQLAACLRSLGVGPQSRVGSCPEQSADLGVAMLGILAAGGVYVPLDPGGPQERLAFMMEDAVVTTVITEERFLPKLPAGLSERGITALSVGERAARAEALESAESSGDGLAYVLYTSGSKGRPKGIGVPYHAIARLVPGTDYVELAADDRIAQVSNSSFDAATFEIWGALIHGTHLVGERRLVPYLVLAGPSPLLSAELRAFLRESLPKVMVPAAFVPLERLPLAPNGKLDRRALSAPEWARGAPYTAPRNEVEEILAGLWAEVQEERRSDA